MAEENGSEKPARNTNPRLGRKESEAPPPPHEVNTARSWPAEFRWPGGGSALRADSESQDNVEAPESCSTPDGSAEGEWEPDGGPYERAWTIRGGGQENERLREAFRRLARRATAALGNRFNHPDQSVDVWLDRVFEYHKAINARGDSDDWRLKRIAEGSAEYCAELATRHHEAKDTDVERTFRDLERQFNSLPNPHGDLRAIRRSQIHLPELSEPTMRKLTVQRDSTMGHLKLTDEEISALDRERQRLDGISTKWPPNDPRHRDPRFATQKARWLGVTPSVRAAEAIFRGMTAEYWSHWCPSGTRYETYASWLELISDKVSTQLETTWMRHSAVTDRWFRITCKPAIEQALEALVKQAIAQARNVEISNIERKQRVTVFRTVDKHPTAQRDPSLRPESGELGLTSPKAVSSAPDIQASENAPTAFAWDEVEIYIPNDLEAQIVFVGRPPRTVDFVGMGFADGRSRSGKKPNKLWDLLLKFARQRGRIENPQQAGLRDWNTVESRVWGLNRVLKRYFQISGSPIRFDNGAYECIFKIKLNLLPGI